MTQNFYKNSIIYAIWTNISRFLGLIRDNFCGRLFGTSIEFGAFTLAFRIPDLFRRLLEEGALSAIYTPVLTQQLNKEERQKAINFSSNVFSILLIIITLFCATLIIFLLGISQLLSLSIGWQRTLSYFLILMPYLIFIALISLLSSILNVLGHFFSTALSPIILNISWITSMVFAWQFLQTNNDRLILICYFLTFAGVLQVSFLLIVLRKYNWKIKFSFQKEILPTKKTLCNILIVIFCFAVFQINLLIDGILCIFFVKSEHALAALYYSDRLQQLPIGLFSISIATASFPLLANFHAQNKMLDFRNTLTKSLRGVWFLTLPCCIGILFLADHLTQQLYSFKDPVSTNETSITLIYFTLSLIFTCTTPILTRVFYAIGEIKTPLIVGAIVILCNIMFGIGLLFFTSLDGSSVALATSLSSIMNACILFYIASNKFKLIDLAQIKRNMFKLMAPSIALTLWLITAKLATVHNTIIDISTYIFWFSNHPQLFYLIASVLGGVVIFIVSSAIIRPNEFKEIMDRSDLKN